MPAPRLGDTIRRAFVRVSPLDVLIGVALSAFAIVLVTGVTHSPGRHGGLGASLAVLTMTAPVIWRRRAPVGVAAVLGAGAVLNALAYPHMVRCGPCLPALFLCAFALGRSPSGRRLRPTLLANAFLVCSASAQSVSDPQIGPAILVIVVPAIVGFWGLGRLVESRSQLVSRLRAQNEELRNARERTAALAVEADRARIAEGLEGSLSRRIAEMATAAQTGRAALAGEGRSEEAQAAFGTIERSGRETLQHMRRVVGTLLENGAPTEPQPTLAELERLARAGGRNEVSVRVTGRRRSLPAGVELAGYRTIEHLLHAFSDTPGTRIDISVDFGTDALELTVRGPAAALVAQQEALAAAQARVLLHNGSLSSARPGREWQAVARLPLPAYV